MYMQAFMFRFVFVGVFGLGIVLSTAFRQPEAQAAAMQATGASSPATEQSSPALPTVTLSTVHVTANSTHAAVARTAHVDPAPAAHIVTSEAGGHGGSLAPTLRLDMPYYSFGKMLPRVGKE